MKNEKIIARQRYGQKNVGQKDGHDLSAQHFFLPQKALLLKRCIHCVHLQIPVLSLRAGRWIKFILNHRSIIGLLHLGKYLQVPL